MKSPDYITRQELNIYLLQAGLYHAAIRAGGYRDRLYAPPRSDWLLGEFYEFYRATLSALGALSYQAESGDCDEFAESFSALARLCHRRMPQPQPAGLPVGIIAYKVGGTQPHAAVVAITSDRGLLVIEPQNGRELHLTGAEKQSAWLIRL